MPVEPTDPADLIDNIANGRITGPADVLADLVRNAVANPEPQAAGSSDGGESGWLDPRTGEAVRQANS